MPYKSKTGRIEAARSFGHAPIVENPFVQNRLQQFRIFVPEPKEDVDSSLLVPAESIPRTQGDIKWVLCFDGSPQEVAVREQYPSTRVGYIQIAGVLVHLEEMLEQAKAHLVDPAAIRRATEEALHSMVLPGSNVCRADCSSVTDSWRAEIYDILRDYTVEGSPFLDVFMRLAALSDRSGPDGTVMLARCPASEACVARDIRVGASGGECPVCRATVFPTDALRVHEEVSEEDTNATALGRLMTVLEHLTMAAYLSFLSERRPTSLGSVGFVLDGPLALFGPQAWLHTALQRFIEQVQRHLLERDLAGPVIVGIEKHGQFAEHGGALGDRIPRETVMMLPDSYIYQHILTFRLPTGTTFGRDTYYGQKFYYRTAQGQLLTITVPKLASAPENHFHPGLYPSMPRTLALLDRIGTTLYEDAVIPVALAHSFASIPLRTGSKVLKLLSQRLLKQP